MIFFNICIVGLREQFVTESTGFQKLEISYYEIIIMGLRVQI